MRKHKNIIIVAALPFLIGTTASVICFFQNAACAIITAVSTLLIIICYIVHYIYINRQIIEISDYLSALIDGSEEMKITYNQEGELSILANNIYKTAKKLQAQTELLVKDKTWLADSLADISHQLKTPITSMTVMTELIRDENLPQEKRKEFLDNISRELDKMQWMIVTLLKLSKFDAGTIDLKQEKIMLNEVVKTAAVPFYIQAEIRGIKLNLDLEEATVIGDAQWTAEAIGNIIKNCLEHTGSGGKVDVICRQTPIFSVIMIKDNGCGIDKSDLPYIFKRFYKGKNSSSNSVGIGLALCKSVLNREKAVIDVKSELGHGTEFTIKFYSVTV